MSFMFATCSRSTALGFIQQLYPARDITDTEDSAGPLLNYVEQDIVRIPDPNMHGPTVEVIPSTNWNESHRALVVAACVHMLRERTV